MHISPKQSSAEHRYGFCEKWRDKQTTLKYPEKFQTVFLEISREFLSVTWTHWNNFHALQTASLFFFSVHVFRIIRVIKSRRMIWAGHVARMEEMRGAYRILMGRPEGRRPLGRPKRRWDNIKMDL
jgi:hypothetical protein